MIASTESMRFCSCPLSPSDPTSQSSSPFGPEKKPLAVTISDATSRLTKTPFAERLRRLSTLGPPPQREFICPATGNSSSTALASLDGRLDPNRVNRRRNQDVREPGVSAARPRAWTPRSPGRALVNERQPRRLRREEHHR